MTSVICPTCGAACSLGGETTRYFIPPKDESERIVDLQRQIAEEKEKLTEAKQIIASCERGGELLADDLDKAKAEIEAMQPMVEACKARHEHHLGGPIIGEDDPCPCITCQWYRDYLDRKQP